jgi:hypothetical protein
MEAIACSISLFSGKSHRETVKNEEGVFSSSASSITRVPFRTIPKKGSLKLTISTDACKNTKDEVNYLEHVQAFITLKTSRRGNTVIFLTSPLGTRFASA